MSKMIIEDVLSCGSIRIGIRDREPSNHEGDGYCWRWEQFGTRDEAEIYLYQQGIRFNDQIAA